MNNVSMKLKFTHYGKAFEKARDDNLI